MSRAMEVWLHQQLHPDEVLITGNAKRHKPRKVWAEKNADIAEYISRHGIERYREQVMEEQAKYKTEQNEPHTD